MKNLFFLALLLSLTSCGKTYDVPSEFQKYVTMFVDGANAHCVAIDISSLQIEFSDLSNVEADIIVDGSSRKAIGACYRSYQLIGIDKSFWNESDEIQKALLIKHELGHCILGREHRKDLLPDDLTPASIMYPSILTNDEYRFNADYYENELYSQQ